MRRALTAITAAAFSVLLSSCGGEPAQEPEAPPETVEDDTAEPEPEPTPETEQSPEPEEEPEPTEEPADEADESAGTPEVELEQAVRGYSEAFFNGDATDAYEALSERCAATVSLSEYTGNLMAVQTIYGDALPDLLTVDVTVSGDEGSATYTYSIPELNVIEQPWLYEGDAWRYDDC